VPPAGDLLLVAENAPERAAQLRDEDRDGVMFQTIRVFTKIVMRLKIKDQNY
jgi:hypothetical protein